MTKVSEARSILRRQVLEKVAAAAGNELAGIYTAIADRYRPGIPQGGYANAAAAVARRPSARPAPRPVQRPTPAVAAGRPLFPQTQLTHYQAPKDYPGAGFLDAADKVVSGAEKIRNGITGAIKPMLTGIGVGFNR